MGHNAILGRMEVGDKPVIDRTHPAVIIGMKAEQNLGEITRGALLVAGANGVTAADSSATEFAGVLTETIDTAEEEVAAVLVHGTVVREMLIAGDAAATDEQIQALAKMGIWAM